MNLLLQMFSVFKAIQLTCTLYEQLFDHLKNSCAKLIIAINFVKLEKQLFAKHIAHLVTVDIN